jgi:hypothetical protein
MNPEQIQQALKALADHDRGLESRVPARAIFARHRPGVRWTAWAGLAAAAGLLVFLWLPTTPVEPVKAPEPVAVVEATPVVEPEIVPVAASEPKPVRRQQAPEPLREVVTDFFPLMDAPPPFERGQLWRVVVPASTMRSVGLPINPERWSERVQADVLVGEEGMARAIRFVSYEQ